MDETTKLLIEALNKNIEIIRREIICKIDDLNLRNNENFNDIKARLNQIESSMNNFVKIEDCEKKTENEVVRQEFSLKRTNIIVTAVAGGVGTICSLITTLFANGTISL